MPQSSNYDLLISKLDQFIRKYYLNSLLRGILYTVAVVVGLFLVFSVLEYFLYFNKGIRKTIFFGFLAITAGALAYWVIQPLIKYFAIGKVISHEQAAQIIGSHFTDVKDKLLNVLQLQKQSQAQQSDLLFASIEQKTEKIKLVPFKSAIDLGSNKRYLPYALPPLLVLVALIFMAPSVIKDSTYRFVNNDEDFERAAPFSLSIDQSELSAIQNSDFVLNVTAEGSVIPEEVFIEVNDFQYRLQADAAGEFSYIFRNVQADTDFRIFSGRVSGPEQTLEVIAKPSLADMVVRLDYPSYVGRKDEAVSNMGDLSVPEGTKVSWAFTADHTDDISLRFGRGDLLPAERRGDRAFDYSRRVRNDLLYKLYISNDRIPVPDSISYAINVAKDQHPTIKVEQFVDSLETDVLYFVGQASDDYGLSALSFNYTITGERGNIKKSESVKVMETAGRETQYDYVLDLVELDLQPGDQLTYFFRVFDNDAVNGRKSAETSTQQLRKQTIEEFEEAEDQTEEEIKDSLKEAKDDLKKMQENFRKMREKMLQEKELDWQDKEDLQKLLDEQKELQEKMEEAKKKFEESLEKQEEFNEQKEEILEKQEKLQQMFEEAVDPETKELMEKIEEMMQELNKDQALEMMEQMEMDDEQMEMEMDRLLELYKNLEVEKEMKEQMEELEKLAEEQEKLAEETENKEEPTPEDKEKQEELTEEFEKLKEEMKETQEKNEELERPKETPSDSEEQMDDIQEDMEQSQEEMEQQDSQGASKSQKSAAQKMQKMAGAMKASMEGGEQEQAEEDIKAVRQLLENLVDMSFDQEDLINDIGATKPTTPRYVDLIQEQFRLKNDFVMIEDSLVALAKRNDKIQTFVLDKVAEVKTDINESIDLLEERQTPQGISSQRSTMTNVNDLALMLNESLQNMQQSMASGMPGSQMCNKPGGKGQGKSGKVPMDKISDGQQGVGESLNKMMGNKEGGKGNSSKDFAKAAAKQAAMRKALEEMAQQKGEQGQNTKELQEIIDQMNKIEEDLVNKRLDGELLKRQQEIKTRLLEAEKAERQREWDNKRKAEVGQDQKRELPPSLKAYLKKREAEVELYKTISPSLRPYYKYLVDEYFRELKRN
jgi:hypothetical protein